MPNHQPRCSRTGAPLRDVKAFPAAGRLPWGDAQSAARGSDNAEPALLVPMLLLGGLAMPAAAVDTVPDDHPECGDARRTRSCLGIPCVRGMGSRPGPMVSPSTSTATRSAPPARRTTAGEASACWLRARTGSHHTAPVTGGWSALRRQRPDQRLRDRAVRLVRRPRHARRSDARERRAGPGRRSLGRLRPPALDAPR